MEHADIRNFKDFLQQYNKITENCFSNCINTLSDRAIQSDELRCVDLCALKHIKLNHKVMQVYLEVQPSIMSRRVEEMTQAQEAALAAAGNTNESVPPEAVNSSSDNGIEQSAAQQTVETISQSSVSQS